MLEIFIYENCSFHKQRMKEYVEDYIENYQSGMVLEQVTDNLESILAYIQENEVSALYFIDLDEKSGETGFYLANQIRLYDKRGKIVFTASKIEGLQRVLHQKIEVLGCILKQDQTELEREMIDWIDLANDCILSKDAKPAFQIKGREKFIREEYENILFFQKVKGTHYAELHTKNTVHELRNSMDRIEKMADSFCRIHQGIVINLENFISFSEYDKHITLSNEKTLPVSNRFKRNLEQAIRKRSGT